MINKIKLKIISNPNKIEKQSDKLKNLKYEFILI
jgi:hypothetical protein